MADWQVLFRKGIRFVLSSAEVEVIGDTGSNEEALKFIESYLPDVAILNIENGKPSGLQIARSIKQNVPSVGIVMVMDRHDDYHIFAAMRSGASACITKDIDPEHLVSIISDVGNGAKPISQALLRATIVQLVLGTEEIKVKLSIDEVNILTRLAMGIFSEQPAATMGMIGELLNTRLVPILSKLIIDEIEFISEEQTLSKPEPLRWWGTPHKGGITWTPIKHGLILRNEEAPTGGTESTVIQAENLEATSIKTTIIPKIEKNIEAMAPQAISDSVNPASPEAVEPADQKKVLWVANDTTSSAEFERVLKIAGFEMMVFTDPEDSLQKFNEASLVVLDDELSHIGDLCSRIRTQSSVPIILIGNKKSENVRERVDSMGANAYLSRSISGRELVARMRSILRRC
ncbi:MAG: response regulator [Dehalococcoidales bacterium]|nr:response regulator [Dehalococcoidales bacterium]